MRTLIIASALTLALGGTAFAQMCGGGMQQQSTAQSGGMGGMSCMGSMKQAADDPMADKPASKPMMGGMMCPCCKNMASMGGMKPEGGAAGEQKHEMPMPKQ
jgi:hypothetical protein